MRRLSCSFFWGGGVLQQRVILQRFTFLVNRIDETLSIKALMVTPLILIFKIAFEKHLGDVVDTILVAKLSRAAERGKETDRKTLEKFSSFTHW